MRAIVSDGLSTNLAAARGLGFVVDKEPVVYTEIEGEGLYLFIDYVHALKLIRNLFASEDYLVNYKGKRVAWKYIDLLVQHQEKLGFKYANKLTPLHVNFHQQEMKVYLATQVFSRSVADALRFLRTSGVPEFQGSEATEEFIRLMNDIFDIFNSRSTRAQGIVRGK